MSDSEELPSITVNSTDSCKFEMPDAAALALLRKNTALQECEIRRIREELSGTGTMTGYESGSDSELASCIQELRVIPPILPFNEGPGTIPSRDVLLAPFDADSHQYKFLDDFLQCLISCDNSTLICTIDTILECLWESMIEERSWSAIEVQCVSTFLAVICTDKKCRDIAFHQLPFARNIFRYLLDQIAVKYHTFDLVKYIGTHLLSVVTDARDRVILVMALEGGSADVWSRKLASGLLHMTTLKYFGMQNVQFGNVCTVADLTALVNREDGWRVLSTYKRYTAALLIAHMLRYIPQATNSTDDAQALQDLLHHLASHSPTTDHTGEELKVKVLISTMSLLLRNRLPPSQCRYLV